MADTITLPGVGTQPKKTVYIAVGGVVVLGLIGYYRRKKAAAAAPATTASQIDPATGYPYGSAEDAAALSSQAGYQTPVGGGSGSSLDFSSGTALTPGGVALSTTFADNQSWERAAIDYLTNTIGLSAGAVSGALGKYLAGQSVTPSEQDIIHQAIASEGQAPVAGANGYPPSIRQAAAPSTVATPFHVADGYYVASPSRRYYKVEGMRRWHVSDATRKHLGTTVHYKPTFDSTMARVPLHGEI
jgi:hypothetical protein